MAGERVAKPLGAICDVKQGRYLSPGEMAESRTPSNPVPVYGANGILGYTDKVMYDSAVSLVTCRGSNCGMLQRTKGRSWISNNAMACSPKIPNESRYLHYLLLASKFADVTTGSAQPQITMGHLNTKPLTLAIDPVEQKAIGQILGTLDDKIEVNERMNVTMEAMAQALYQSWFVDFEPVRAKLDGRLSPGLDPATAELFPAHFDRKAAGVVPTGWRATTLAEVIEVFDSKRIPLSGRERDIRKGPFPYHGAASVMDHIDGYLFDGIYLLMGEDGSVINEDGSPVLQYVWGKFWVNNHAHVLRGKNGVCAEHLLLHLKNCNITAFVTGAVQPKLNQGNMNRIPFMLPPPEIGQAFAKTIEPLFAQIRANTDQSRTLATLRDTLLPKLLSGELSAAGTVAKSATVQTGKETRP